MQEGLDLVQITPNMFQPLIKGKNRRGNNRKTFHRRVLDKNRLAKFTWHFPRCALLACWQCSWRVPDAASHITSKLSCTSRRKPKSQLLDTVTVVTTHFVACKKQELRQRKHGQLRALKDLDLSEAAHPFRYSGTNTPLLKHCFCFLSSVY